jgi:radical SAM superfamily enzyme YgiQ (UPF0313 family)
MKILISYPPLDQSKGFATLGQNRQFQYFAEPTFIYPVVPAQAATALRDAGHTVIWNDCIAEGLDRADFFRLIEKEKPDLIVFETKTPVIKQHWRLINEVKAKLSTVNYQPSTVLVGDHVTALPEESMRNSGVDFILTGGDYDFLLLSLCRALKRNNSSFVIRDSSLLEPGIWYREGEKIKNTGPFRQNHDLQELPPIDRDLTRWELYAYQNGNYKRTPGTYIMSGRDCWWGRCSFCSWTTLYPRFRVRPVEKVLDEIGGIIEKYPVREIMDDTGTFPRGEWLRDFCRGAAERGYRKRVGLDCNFRFGAATEEDYRLMKRAGFRFLLFGLESANQKTLDRLGKGLKVETIVESCRRARQAGLYPPITIMFGYPWESYEDAARTYELGRYLLTRGYAYTMQATLVVPYPGTPLYRECREKGWLLTSDWDDFDMRKPVMRIPFPEEKLLKLIRRMYRVAFDPRFLAHKILSVRDLQDLKFFLRAGRKVLGHLKDFTFSNPR